MTIHNWRSRKTRLIKLFYRNHSKRWKYFHCVMWHARGWHHTLVSQFVSVPGWHLCPLYNNLFFQASLEVEWHFFLVGRSWCPIRRSKLSFMMGLIQYSLLNTLMRLRISCGVSSFEEHRHLELQANPKQNWTKKTKAIPSI